MSAFRGLQFLGGSQVFLKICRTLAPVILNSALDADEWSVSRLGCFTPVPLVPGACWIEGWVQCRTTGRASGEALWGVNLQGALRRDWNNRKYGPSKLRFPHAKEFLWKFSAIRACVLESHCQPSPRPKMFKEYPFKGRQIISLSVAPTSLGPGLAGWTQVQTGHFGGEKSFPHPESNHSSLVAKPMA